MNLLLSLGLSIGALAGVWTAISVVMTLSTFAGFAAWATYFAVGGGTKGLKDTVLNNLSGVFWGVMMIQLTGVLTPMMGSTVALSVAVAIGAFAMCIQANVSHFAFIPGAFIGCAIYFATGSAMVAAIGLVSGAVFGWASDKGAALLRGEKAEKAA